jgi:hypothetical protein
MMLTAAATTEVFFRKLRRDEMSLFIANAFSWREGLICGEFRQPLMQVKLRISWNGLHAVRGPPQKTAAGSLLSENCSHRGHEAELLVP